LTAKPKILLVCDSRENAEQLLARAADSHEVVVADDPLRILTHLTEERFAGVYVSSEYLQEALAIAKLLQNEQILEGMPDGVVLLDSNNSIIWGNGRLREWSGRESIVGANFYTVLGSPQILGPDFCPFHTALATGQATSSTLRSGENRYYHVHAAPVHEVDSPPRRLIVTVREVTNEVHQQQKMAAIHQAGM
jgi:two-component system, sensor histidine kinase SagS